MTNIKTIFVVVGALWGFVSSLPYLSLVAGYVPVPMTWKIVTFPSWIFYEVFGRPGSIAFLGDLEAHSEVPIGLIFFFVLPVIAGGLIGYLIFVTATKLFQS
jgi:hypothetical protein